MRALPHHVQSLAGVSGAHAARNYAEGSAIGLFHSVERGERVVRCEHVGDLRDSLVYLAVGLVRTTWENNPFRRVSLEPAIGQGKRLRLIAHVEER